MSHEKLAGAILREVPLAKMRDFLKDFGGGDPLANGNGCGNACGNNCIDGFGLTLDRFGHAQVSDKEVIEARDDVDGLRTALKAELERALG